MSYNKRASKSHKSSAAESLYKARTEIKTTNNEGAYIVNRALDIVAAFVSNNSIKAEDLPTFLRTIFDTIDGLAKPRFHNVSSIQNGRAPAVSIESSVTPDFIVCLEDGKRCRSLRKHLSRSHQMSPEQYRKKWQLPANYPMLAQTFSDTMSRLTRTRRAAEQKTMDRSSPDRPSYQEG